MKRREVIGGPGTSDLTRRSLLTALLAAATCPSVAQSQRRPVVIGFLHSGSQDFSTANLNEIK